MASGNPDHQFRQKMVDTLRIIGATVSWAMMVCGVLILPAIVVFALPFLPSSQSIPSSQVSKNSFQDGARPILPAIIRHSTYNEIESSGTDQPQTSPHILQHQKPDTSQGTIHLVVDTSRHRLFVKEGDRILHMAIVSTGSGNILSDPRNTERTWTFETPKGTFSIQSKLEKPVWIRPDWAFIEQGDPVPEKVADRLQPGVLGQYALGFGNGYFIHGALYTNLLGQNVTHGCIQLHPEDLQFLFEAVPLGTPLIII